MAQEKNFENRVKAYLKDNRVWFIKYWGGAAFTKAGVPDILACIRGQFVAIEVKADNGTVSELQKHTLNEINFSGGYGLTLYPKDFEEFQRFCRIIIGGDLPYKEDFQNICTIYQL